MRIWWCQQHQCSEDVEKTDQEEVRRWCVHWSAEVWSEQTYGPIDPLNACRMVPMRLIPDNAPIFNDRVAIRAFQLLDGQRLDMGKGDLAELFARAIYEVNRGLDGETP